jgi:hypothetical protein
VGLGGLVQLGYYWFDRLAMALASRGVDFWMMDEPFNHRRTPHGYLPAERIDLHGARFDRLVLYRSVERLAAGWGTRCTAHPAGHYSIFFGDRLRRRVVDFIIETAAREPTPELACLPNR